MTTTPRDASLRRPTYIEGHENLIRKVLSEVRVSLPAVVTRYDAATQTCAAQVSLTNEDGSRLAVVEGVPVVWMGGGGAALTFPLEPGDPVILLFAERSLERWKAQGDYRPPNDPRRFDLSDAVAISGARPPRAPLASADADDVVLGLDNGNMQVRITPAGRVFIGNQNTSVELLDLIDQYLSALMTSTRATSIGPQPLDPTTMTTLGQLRVSLQGLKT